MAWLKAVINFKPANIGTGIKVSLRGSKRATLTLNVSRAEAIILGISDQDKLEVLIGDGQQHGLIRIRKNNSVGEAVVEKKEAAKGDYFCVRLGHQPLFVNRAETARWVQWEKVEDGWFEIVLPKWADETAKGKVAIIADAPVRPTVAPKGPAANARAFGTVTQRLMGDPDPSRSALAQKG